MNKFFTAGSATISGFKRYSLIMLMLLLGLLSGNHASGQTQVYSQSFTYGGTPSSQCTAWNTFRTNINLSLTYTGIQIGNGPIATGAAAVSIITALKNGTAYGPTANGGYYWEVGTCTGIELGAMPVSTATCACPNPGYIVRPCIGNDNWGGTTGGLTCAAGTQTMTVTLFYTPSCPTLPALTGTTSVTCGSTTTLSCALPTGGTITQSGGNNIHTFTSSSSLVVPTGFSEAANVLVVGGGGGGGQNGGGGGGGGGVSYLGYGLSAGTITATVGAGGTPGVNTSSGGSPGAVGGSSVFGGLITLGGGGGANRDYGGSATSGGSGGGGGGGNYPTAATGVGGQGNSGGTGYNNGCPSAGGGGGGAGGAGGNGAYNAGAAGGPGVAYSISGSSVTYGGGGGGGPTCSPGTSGAGGSGGGGAGNGTNGTANTGGGGGGNNGTGGTGIVIVSYPYGTWSSSNTAIATVNSSGVVTGVAAGTATISYKLTSCSVASSTTVTVTGASVASVTGGTTPICVGATTTCTANSIVLAGGTGSWSSSNNAVATVNSSGLVTGAGGGTCNITYTITGGCGGTVSASQSITVAGITASPSTASQTKCVGGTFTALSITATGSPTYQWYRNYSASTAGADAVLGATNSTYTPPSAAASTTYFYCVISGCATSGFSGAIIVDQPVATISPATTSVCQGSTVALTAAGGSTYQWGGSSSANTAGITAGAGSYTVTVTDGNSCSASTSQVIYTNQVPAPVAITGTTQVCLNGTTQLSSPWTAATGGTITNANGYTIHTFTTTGAANFVTTSALNAEVLVVGGGGGAGNSIGGGGGGGGVVYESSQPFAASTTYAVTVGGGGAGGTGAQVAGTSGSASTIGTIGLTAAGGGGGGNYSDVAGIAGGSGGGAGGSQSAAPAGGAATGSTLGTGGTGTIYGNKGGNVVDARNTFGNTSGAGGGGAGAPAMNVEDADPNANRSGGAGVAFNISGTSYYYGAGGGAGACCGAGANAGNGGVGGGGGGAAYAGATSGTGGTGGLNPGAGGAAAAANANGGNAGANTGGGGGGASWYSDNGGSGGSGIVIISYPTLSGGTWTSSNTSVATVNSSTGLVTGVGVGTATITYSVTSCGVVGTATTTVTVSNITAQPSSASQTECLGGSFTPLSVTATSGGGALSYQWYRNYSATTSGADIVIGTGTNSTYTPPSTAAGTTYFYCVVNGVCTSALTGAEIVDQPIATISPATTSVCQGATVALTASGGNTYQWSGSSSASTAGITAGVGSYTVVATDGNSCTASASRVITQNMVPSPVALTGTTTISQCGTTQLASTWTAATGGTVTTGNGYTIHTFTSGTTNFVTNSVTNAEILAVGGGGGGGSSIAGGGGGGGVVYESSQPLAASSTYAVTVGAGGAGGLVYGGASFAVCVGSNGASTTITGSGLTQPITAAGGGGGGSFWPNAASVAGGNGNNGGSGGGAGGTQAWIPNTAGAATGSAIGTGGTGTIYGNAGGAVVDLRNNFCNTSGAGGGGAGAPGLNVEDADPNANRNGGNGVAFNISGTQYYYGGGGGAGTFCQTTANNNGGLGGGGGGGTSSASTDGAGGTGGVNNGAAGVGITGGAGGANTGGGGGGAGWQYDVGGNGGSGVVIIRYPTLSGGTWASSNTTVATVNSSGLVTAVGPGTTTISYTVTSCSVPISATTTVTVTGLAAQPSAASQTVCVGGTFTPASVTVVGSPAIQWYRNYTASTTGADPIPGATNATYAPPTAAASTTYFYCTVGCVTSAISGAFIVDQPVATISPATTSVCQGSTVSLTAAGGTSYQWGGSSTANTAGITAGVGSYTVTATDGNSCTASASRVITQNMLPSPAAITGNTTICGGLTSQLSSPFTAATGGTVTTSNGYTIHTFTTAGAANFVTNTALNAEVLVVGGGGGGGSSIGGGGGGGGVVYESIQPFAASSTYVVTVGAGGAGGNGTEVAGATGAASSIGTIGLTAAGGGGGGNYNDIGGLNGGNGGGAGGSQYSAPAGGTATGSTLGSGGTGTIYGCAGGSLSDNRGIFSNTSGAGGGGAGGPGMIVETADPNANRNGGNGVAFSISGTSYYYGGGGGAGACCTANGAGTASGGSGGAGGGGGGAAYASPAIVGTGGTGGLNSGNAGAGVGLGLNGGAGGTNTGGGGGGGTWETDAGGNGGSGIVIIRYPNLAAGTWTSSNTGVATVNSSGLVTAVGAGTTTITYTVTSCSIPVSVTTTVTVNPAVTATVTPTSGGTYCSYASGSVLTVTAGAGTPGYTYNWSNSLGTGTTATPTAQSSTIYTVTVTDTKNCTATASTGAVTVDAVMVSPTPASATKLCSYATNGAIGAGASAGTTPYTYVWNNGLGTGSNGTPTITTGTVYNVVVTDHNGCTATGNTGSISIDAVVTAVASPSATTTVCPYATSGALSVAPGGGTGVYTYLWNNSMGTGATATPVSTSVIVYTVTVTDNNFCTAVSNTGSVNVDPAMTVAPTPSSTTLYCSYNNNGKLVANAGGGSSSYTYLWSNGLGTGATATPTLSTGTVYGVTITDSKSCTISGNTGSVTVDPAVVVTPTPGAATFYCSYQNSGVLHAGPSGGSGTYSTYAWSGGLGSGATASPTIGAAAAYTVTVTDNVGCTGTGSTGIITVNPVLTSVPTPSAATFYCSYATTNVLNAVPGGGTSPYTYVWSNSLGTALNATPITGTVQSYTVTVTDHNLCTVSANTAVITVDPTITVNPTANGVNTGGTTYVCSYSNTGALAAGAGGGTPGYSYLWNNSLGTSSTATPIITSGTTYSVTVTDNKNCTASANIGPVVDYAPPTITGTTPGSICGTGTVNLGASSSAGTVNWWPALTGGTPPSANTGGSYTTPIISTNTNFYVDATSNGCTTQSRTSVLATVYPTTISSGGFYYSTSPTYATILASGTQVVSTNAVNAGIVTQAISGLLPCTTYYYVTYIVTNSVVEYALTVQSFTTGSSPATISLSSGAGTDAQSICAGGSVTNITYSIGGGGSGATFSGLPSGINGSYAGGVATISGSSSATPGVYSYTVNTTGTCTQTSASGTITINAVPALTLPTPSAQSVCANGAIGGISTTPSGGAGTISYQWFSNTTNAVTGGTSLGSSNGAQTTTYAPPATATTGTTYYYCVMSASGSGCTTAKTASAAGVTIIAVPALTVPTPSSQAVCANGAINSISTTSSGGAGTFGFQWYSNSSNAITGGTSLGSSNGAQTTTYSPPATSTAGTTYYYCVMTASGSGCTSATTASTAAVTVNNAPALTVAIPSGQTVCANGAIGSISTTPSGGAGTIAYQWYSNSTSAITGGTSLGAGHGAQTTTYSPPATASVGTTYFYCVMTATGSGCNSATTASTAGVTVTAVPALTIPAPASQSVCANGAISSISTTSSGGTGSISYQWYANGSNANTGGTSLGSANGANTTTYSPPVTATAGTTYYYCVMSATGSGCSAATTASTASVAVSPVPALTLPAPSSQTVCENGAVGNISTISTGGAGTISYQWYSNTSNSITGGTSLGNTNGAQTITYSPPSSATDGSVYYYCVMTATGNGCTTASTASTASVTVVPVPALTVASPASQLLCANGSAVGINTTASGGTGTISYQWYSNSANATTGGTTLGSANGGQTTTYTAPATSTLGTTYYYCVMSATGSGCASATTPATASISVEPVVSNYGTITATAGTSQSLCANVSPAGTFTVTGAAGGSGTFSYQWYYQAGLIGAPSGAIPGSWTPCSATNGTGYNAATFAPSGTSSNISYACVATPVNTPSCSGIPTWASGVLQMTVGAPTASITGGNVQVCVGGAVTLNASSIFAATWQWYGSPDNVTFTAIPTATSTTYVPSTSTPGLEYYNAIATYSTGSGCTPATSNSDSVSVSPQPVASTPASASICTGGTNTITLTATGGVSAPAAYQWQISNGFSWSNIVNNTPSGMTYSVNSSGGTSTLTFSTITSVLSGTFSYRGYSTNTGTGCSVTVYSNTAQLSINVQPVAANITPNVAAGPVCAGQTLSAAFNGASGGTGTLTDVYEYSIDGGNTFNPYLQNQAINTSALSGQTVIVRSSRTASGSGCNISPYKTVTWNVIAQPVAATITPNVPAGNICTGEVLSATFSGASGGSGTVTDVYLYSTDGGNTFNTYTGGQGISTSALTGQTVVIQSSRTATGTGCNTSAFNTLSWNVVAQPVSATITPNVAAGNVCTGQTLSATFSGASGGSGTITDVYEYSIDGGNTFNAYSQNQPISTNTLSGQSVVVRSSRTSTGSGCNTSTYNTVTWNVVAQPVASAITPNVPAGNVCAGQTLSASFSGGSGGSGTLTDVYEYSIDDGSTFNAYAQNQAISTNALSGQSVVVRSSRTATGSGCSSSSYNTVTWNVVAQPVAATIIPNVAVGNVCVGETLSASFSGGSGGSGTITDVYEFSLDGGTTFNSYVQNQTISTSSLTGQTVVIRSSRTATGSGCNTSGYNTVSWTVIAQPTAASITPNVAAGSVCTGQILSASFSGGGGGSGTITDVYEYSVNGGTSFSPYTQNQAIATTTLSGQTVIVRSSRTSTGTGCNTSTYNTVTWTIVAQPVAATISPNIPTGNICAGQIVSASFSGGSGGGGTVTDVYEFSIDGGNTYNAYTGGQSVSTGSLTGQTVIIRSSRTSTGSGCNTSGYNTVSWNVVAQPVAATITPNVAAGNVCAGQSLSATFSGASGGSGTITDVYEYSIDGGTTFNPYTNAQAINTDALAGVNVIVRSSRTATGGGCNTSTYNTVTWSVIAQPVSPSITPNIAGGIVCDGQTVSATFAGGSGGSGTVANVYEYSLDGGATFSSYVPSTPLSTTGLTGQTVIIRSSRTSTGTGCNTSGYNTVSWSVTATPSISASNAGPFCNYSTITISASPSGYSDYQWSGPNGYGPVDGISQTLAASGNAGTYTVTVTNSNGCSSTASTNVSVVGTIPATAGNTGPYCATANILLSSGPTVNGYSYRWAGPNSYTAGIQDPAGFIANGNAGTYTVIVTDANGCSASASTDVSVYPATSASAANFGPYVVGQTISLSASSAGAVSYAWSGPNGYSGTGQAPTISDASTAMAGTYTVTATNSTGCTASASTDVVVTTTATYTWTGTTGSNWTDPTNWIPSSPIGGPNACAIDVIIPNTTTSPTINSAISVGNLQMNSGALLTLNSANISVCKNLTGGTAGHAAVIGDGIVVLTGSTLQTFTGYFRMQELMLNNGAGASMLAGSAVDLYTSLDLQTGNFDATNGTLTFKSNTVDSVAILDNFSQNYTGTITGNITAERYYAASETYSQHYMGSPVNSPSLVTQWGASGTAGQVTDNNCDELQLNWNSPYGTVFQMDQHLGAACSVVEWTVLTSGNAQNGIGYSILKNDSGKVVLNGQANLDANYQIGNLQNDGWSNFTLQGRPSKAGWQLLANPYLATLELSNVPMGFDNQVQIWNANGLYAGTFQPGNIGENAVVAPFQGFMVHKTTPGGTATYIINATDRVRTPQQFYQQNANELKILATNITTGMLDQTTVAFNSAATDTFDAQYDAQKIAGSLGRHTIYTENNNIWMARNVLHSEATTSTVPMGFEPGKTGNYSFSFGGVNTFDPTSYIYLEDRTNGQWYNVRNGNYSFNADSADAWSRFVLHFTPPASITTTDATCNTGGTISIQQPGTANWNYTLADSTSNVIAHGTLNQTQPVTLQAATGTYTLTLTDTNNYVAVKTIQVNGPAPVSAAFMVSADTVIPQQTVVVVANTQDAASYLWNFGNGVTGTGSQAMVSYTQPGVYVLSLAVTNNAGCSSTQTHSITVSNNSPTGLNNLSGTGAISIWSNANKVFVDFTSIPAVDATVAIYNILGQEICNEHYSNSNIYQKEIDGIEAAYMIVMVRNADKITTRKVLITNSH